jgi:hypothetical protein
MITFFHKFGEDIAEVLYPLYSLQNSKDWYWKAPEQQAYDKALHLTADASPVGAGYVLARDKRWKGRAYRLQQNPSQIEDYVTRYMKGRQQHLFLG